MQDDAGDVTLKDVAPNVSFGDILAARCRQVVRVHGCRTADRTGFKNANGLCRYFTFLCRCPGTRLKSREVPHAHRGGRRPRCTEKYARDELGGGGGVARSLARAQPSGSFSGGSSPSGRCRVLRVHDYGM